MTKGQPNSADKGRMDKRQKVMNDQDAKPSFLGWTFACLGLTYEEEKYVDDIVRLHGGRIEGKLANGRHRSVCSHLVVSYWYPLALSSELPVLVSLHWLELVHKRRQLIPYESSTIYQPPPYSPVLSYELSYPIDYEDGDWQTYVHLPCSPRSMLTDGVPRWPYIFALLQQPIPDTDALERVIHRITGRTVPLVCLREALKSQPATFFTEVLPNLTRLALMLPSLFAKPVPLLLQQSNSSVTLTKRQVAALLVHAFLCTFPPAHDSFNVFECSQLHIDDDEEAPSWAHQYEVNIQKLRTLLHYLTRVVTDGYVNDDSQPGAARTFVRYSRSCIPKEAMPPTPSSWSPVAVNSSGVIEADHGALQVDFANKFAGGGVLGHGCVQEEIRFLINPECLVSCLLTQVLEPNECFVIHGAEQFASYSGYGASYTFAGNFIDSTPIAHGLRNTVIVGIDAFKYYRNTAWHQYRAQDILRELVKAHVGFLPLFDENPQASQQRRHVATGNWGCGVFGGDVELKFIIQWLAASINSRPMAYYTFKNERLEARLTQFVAACQQTSPQIIVDKLIQDNARFRQYMKTSTSVFEYLMLG
ncbi:unnamed protein product [Aphanomyces euteiches]